MRIYNCFCLSCGERFKIESEEEPITPSCTKCESKETKVLGHESGIFGKIASMSPQDKQKVLKKRSTDHYKKEIKEKKEYLDRSTLGMER